MCARSDSSEARAPEHSTLCTTDIFPGPSRELHPLAVGMLAGIMERSLRNFLVVSFGFLLLFTAYGGLQNLQSSLHSKGGLGVATLSALYGAILLSSMFLPPILIKRFGCKWTITGAMGCYVAFFLGNFKGSWYTLVPTSVLLGLGAAPLWSAQCTYLTVLGTSQARKAGKLSKDVVNKYFGIFFFIFQSSGVWGNLISSLVLGQTPNKEFFSEDQLKSCGAKDCLMSTAASTNITQPSQKLVYTLLSIYTGSGVLAILLIIMFLEPIDDNPPSNEGKKSPPLWSTLLSTFRLLRDKRLRLLIPLPLYSGLQQGFLSGEYTRSYATCALGIQFVGYVMICFSAASSLCSLLYGKISQYTGRAVLYALGTVTHLSCIVTFLLWQPHPAQMAVFFILPGLWGVADAVWQTQNSAEDGLKPLQTCSMGFCLRGTRKQPLPTTASGKPWGLSSPLGAASFYVSAPSSMFWQES
ncbi:protein unc-93 homolog A isoform X2 [Octodon degus]|uniref:Protein unc-93 homolog A n=1 Tax=Octodon degus TaxID=10160 RepID=A0A6P6DQI7_OCTDE|nr:protein unc-93 homolog A isoform X2 [Octodon degus]